MITARLSALFQSRNRTAPDFGSGLSNGTEPIASAAPPRREGTLKSEKRLKSVIPDDDDDPEEHGKRVIDI